MSNGEHDGVQLEAVLLDYFRPEQLVLPHLFPVRQAQPLVFLPLRPLFTEKIWFSVFYNDLIFLKCTLVGTSPMESVGAPGQMTVSKHIKSEGYPSPLSPPPSSLFCYLCIIELYLRLKNN